MALHSCEPSLGPRTRRPETGRCFEPLTETVPLADLYRRYEEDFRRHRCATSGSAWRQADRAGVGVSHLGIARCEGVGKAGNVTESLKRFLIEGRS